MLASIPNGVHGHTVQGCSGYQPAGQVPLPAYPTEVCQTMPGEYIIAAPPPHYASHDIALLTGNDQRSIMRWPRYLDLRLSFI